MKQMTDGIDRRTVLRGVGALAVTGTLAGCGGGDGGGNGDDDDGGTPTEGGGVPSEVDSYLSDANNYDGSASEASSVDVGAGNGLAFGPAAIRVSTGTTVTWEWTGNGGPHNVVHEDGDFDSGETVATQGETFEYTFEEAGNYLYYCEPHQGSGMLGAVIVE